jgi:excisionase family DNA binding protein
MTLNASVSPAPAFSNLLWNEQQIASATGISIKQVQQLARRGILPAFKLGRAWRFDPEAIHAWIKKSGKSKKA